MRKSRGAVIIVAYNRPKELIRLIEQLQLNVACSYYDLIVSIDKGPLQDFIFESINDLTWSFGSKVIIKKPYQLGLKKHVIECGDLSKDYDYILMLEEDLVVSNHALEYAKNAVDFYKDDQSIAGISLYSYSRRESDRLSFHTVHDGSDVYFMQFAPSWGQVWTSRQWSEFKIWFEIYDCENFVDDIVPEYVCHWPKSSWKKHFIRYLIMEKKYFVFPRIGLSTNLGTDGMHHKNIFRLYATTVLLGYKKWSFCTFDSSKSVYDSSFLLLSSIDLKGYEDCLEFVEGCKIGGPEMFFKAHSLRSTFLFRVFVLAFLNDLKKIYKKVVRV